MINNIRNFSDFHSKNKLLNSDIYKLLKYRKYHTYMDRVDIFEKYKKQILFAIENSSNNDLYNLREYMHTMRIETKDNEILSLIERKINETPDIYIRCLIKNIVNEKVGRFKKLDDFNEIMFLIIKELVENEKIKYSDICEVGQGAYSTVLQIGDKVLKIGCERANLKFDKIPYVIQPLLRRNFEIENEIICVEITERVDTNSVNINDLSKMCEKIHKLGYVWEDGNVKNLGRLLKDNVIHFNKFISPLDETLNYNSVDNKKILKKGEVVILDSDHIYRKEDYEKIYAKRRTLK